MYNAGFKKIKSSVASGIAYNNRTQELFIRFNSGKVYVYQQVPVEVYRELNQAPSFGKAFQSLISGKYNDFPL